jgi:hypothetical protein
VLLGITYVKLAGYVLCVNGIITAFRILLSALNGLVTVCSVTIQTTGYHNIISLAVVINKCNYDIFYYGSF